MEVTINYNGQAVAVEVTLEVYEFLDRADHKTENLFHEQRRHWDGREFDEYIITTEGVGAYGETPEEYLCHMEALHELMAVLDTCTEAQRRRFLLYAIDGLSLAEIGTKNLSAYLRKMAVDGYVVQLDLPELKELVSLLRRSSNNLNQLTRKVHETGRIYDVDLEDISQRQEKLWDGVKEILTQLSKLS